MSTPKSAIDLIAAIRPDIATHGQDVVSERQREQLLRSITGAAFEESAPVRRRRPVYRRPVMIGAFAAGAAALAVVAVVVIPSGGGSTHAVGPSHSPGPVVDAAYVIKQMTSAIANADNEVVHSHIVMSPPGAAPGTGYVFDQWYRYASGVSRMVSTAPDGTICLDDMATGIAAPTSPDFPDALPMTTGANTTITAANHQNRTWWTWSMSSHFEWPAPPECASAPGDLRIYGYDYPAMYTSVLTPVYNIGSDKEMLADGQLHIEGNGPIVDGQPTIKMALGPYPSGVSGTVLVNAATYQPLSQVTTSPQGGRVETDIEFLSPTPANLAKLTLTVPAGYRQVPPQIQHAVRKK